MKETLNTVYEILDGKKAMEIRILDVSKVCSFTDYFVICSGANQKHIQTLAEELEEKLKKQTGLKPAHVEGSSQAEWVLMDYFDMVVHIMSLEAREFYELERLWADGVELEIPKPK
jgi:ribosome-associated protein